VCLLGDLDPLPLHHASSILVLLISFLLFFFSLLPLIGFRTGIDDSISYPFPESAHGWWCSCGFVDWLWRIELFIKSIEWLFCSFE
jgi:hypothetical protein